MKDHFLNTKMVCFFGKTCQNPRIVIFGKSEYPLVPSLVFKEVDLRLNEVHPTNVYRIILLNP